MDNLKKILLDYSSAELTQELSSWGEPSFRALQIFKGLHSGKEFLGISNIPKDLRARLSEKYVACPVKIKKVFESSDGTKKYLYELSDGNLIEGVLMRYKYGNTLCVSTQVGCRMNCAFCASGIDGLVRNLTSGEILGQVVAVNADEGGTLDDRKVTNIVLMGSGEPFDNFDNVVSFLKNVNEPSGICISERNISLSTCGLVNKIREFADLGFSVNLTISLHAPTDELRSSVMPVNKAFGVKEVVSAAKYYFEKTGRRVIFEYAMIGGVNDSAACAEKLASLVSGFPAHINLIRLNYVEEKKLKPSSKSAESEFLKILTERGSSVTVRRTIGADIEGACGQLRRRFVANGGDEN